ncbi:DUF2628 domain-containing protein [Phreatobacter oligotrophus]|jgi:hypothetical protein|uniref:Uncharacterized protein DUF2628 n=1 Tax=Phreatobacter oligotrophus TaxID=1122261 RepID=A0A2T4YXP0_9HYPH|nr:DUF2628 domain-containing protein [Phreatobacter oligotrophus]PTM51113.1 uncharacterized protein DUF2628 [Phreatobacter oligotrophus]
MARQTSYTVHLPPTGSDEGAQFVPDSFAPIAFVAPWAWFPFHRLWLVTIAYLVAMVAVVVALSFSGLPSLMQTLITSALSLLIGLEATNLKRWTLRRRGWREVAVVVAASREEAERRYFAERDTPVAPSSLALAATRPATSAAAPSAPLPIIGLFPDADPSARGAR